MTFSTGLAVQCQLLNKHINKGSVSSITSAAAVSTQLILGVSQRPKTYYQPYQITASVTCLFCHHYVLSKHSQATVNCPSTFCTNGYRL